MYFRGPRRLLGVPRYVVTFDGAVMPSLSLVCLRRRIWQVVEMHTHQGLRVLAFPREVVG